MTNDVFGAVRTVMAVRQYVDKHIPEEVLLRIVEAAHLSASASNLQPWHFVLVTKHEGLKELAALVRTGPYIGSAAAAVVAAYEKSSSAAISDVSRAIQSMILTAWGDGVGSNWTGLGGLEAVRKLVGLPDKYEVFAVIPLGYPKHAIKGKKKRKPLSEVASAERFANPL